MGKGVTLHGMMNGKFQWLIEMDGRFMGKIASILPGTCLSSSFGFEPSKRPALSVQNKGHLGSRCTV